jgi:1,4-alpha-glucan branching enzyme
MDKLTIDQRTVGMNFNTNGRHYASPMFMALACDINEFQSTDEQWRNIPLEQYVYDLHTGTFSEEGAFEAIAAKIEPLKSLGITAVELMPVAHG